MADIHTIKKLGGKLSVLYAEDEGDLRESVDEYLKKIFSKVDTAKNGQEALELYGQNSYDIIISDILMPKLNGLELSRKIKELNDEQEIIIISAYSDSKFFLEAIEMGINGYVIKPINFRQFNDTLYKSAQKIVRFKENRMYNEHLEELVKERSKELLEAEAAKVENFEKTLLALVEMIEDRDTYTAGHSQRVANYSKLIAKELGFSDEDCELIYRAGILHDIGKVATPDTVLLKPGRLNPLEYRLIQEHVDVGYDLLSKIPMYKDLAEIMRYHHERYDGQGYPNKLFGEEMHTLAKVMAVADAFDAMTTNRIYKGRKSISEAIDEIKNLSGKQFDPKVADAAYRVLKRIKSVEDTTQLPETQLEQERFSYYYRDQVTSSYNRDYLDLVLHKNKDDKKYDEVDIFYLHNFSNYNDKYGWTKGDEMLAYLALMFQNEFESAMIFRLYGDDFVLIDSSKLDVDIEKINKNKVLKEADLYFSHHRLSLISKGIYDLQFLERSLKDI